MPRVPLFPKCPPNASRNDLHHSSSALLLLTFFQFRRSSNVDLVMINFILNILKDMWPQIYSCLAMKEKVLITSSFVST